ncbi:potassium channel family protein [Vibrio owensii]|uniref:potassium channel family protein n=1 Tax=Vibrio owensii TaxID=696485 RepID=UPI0018F14778|nr:potassium channel family protein [Vibrio owensii]
MQARAEKRLKKLKTDSILVILTLIIVVISAIPIYHIESQYPDSSIKSLADSLWFMFATMTTVGWGDLTVNDPISKWLVVLCFATTRGVFLFAVFSTGRAILGKHRDELSQDERITMIEHEIKQTHAVLYNIDQNLRRAEKRRKQEEHFDKTYYASTEQSLLDLIDNKNLQRAHIHCQFEMEALYFNDTEQWLNIKRVAKHNKIHSISFSDGQNVILAKQQKKRTRYTSNEPNHPF